jgi:hypothetical protein
MATVNKDFKIKSGLVVEGANGTIGGHNILTQSTSGDQYILNLIGGETLVKSVSNEFDVSVAGELSIDRTTVDAYYDAAGSASAAQTAAEGYADGLASNYDPAGSAQGAYNNAVTYVDGEITTALQTAQGYADSAETDANSYTDTAITNLNLAGTYDALGSAAQALSDAEDYADAKISDANGTATDKAWSAYKTSTEIGLAQAAAEQHADEAVAALIDAAPAMLDTLNELAAALGDDEDFIGTVNAAIGEKVAKAGDTMTGELVLAADPTQAYAAATKQYVDGKASDAYNDAIVTAASDATTKANAAEQNAKDYADTEIAALSTTDIEEGTNQYFTNQRAIDAVTGTINDAINALDTDDIEEGSTNLYFTDSRAKTSAADLLTGATLSNITITGNGSGLTITAENGVAQSTTDDLTEGDNNLYFTDERAIDAVSNADIYPNAVIVDNVAKQVASQITAATAGTQVGHAFAKASYRSAEFLVKVAYGDHTEISKVLLTLDVNDNISITEYGVVGTNGSASTISADISGTDVRLLVTTANNNSTVTVMGTLLI